MTGALTLWHVLTAASVAYMICDLATNTPAMDVALTLAALAIAMAITTRFARIRF